MMKALTFCKYCGTLLKISFCYCPYCGNPKEEKKKLDDIINYSLQKIKKMRTQDYLHRLTRLEKILDNLEKELDSIIMIQNS